MNISDNCNQWLMNMHDFSAEEEFWNKLSQEEQALFTELRKKNLARQEYVKNLEDENEYYFSAFDALPLPMAIKDKNRKWLFVNKEYRRVIKMHMESAKMYTEINGEEVKNLEETSELSNFDISNIAYFSDESKESFLENCTYAIEHCAIVQQEFSLGHGEDKQNYIYWLTGFETASNKRGLVSVYYDDSFFQSILDRLNKKIVDLEKEQQNIIKTSTLDPLTGAYNRQVLSGFLEEAIKDNKEKDSPFSVLMLDIDHFKKVNDTYGHLIGDQVLQLFVMLLKTTLRDRDYVVRFGGEEFLIILHGTPFEFACKIAERIRVIMEENMSTPMRRPITVSIGVVSYHKDESIKELLQRVDDNLYKAKTSGRNLVVSSN